MDILEALKQFDVNLIGVPTFNVLRNSSAFWVLCSIVSPSPICHLTPVTSYSAIAQHHYSLAMLG